MTDFLVLCTPHFERLYRGLKKRHRGLASIYAEALSILQADPYNRSQRHPVKKLVGARPGEGQYRLRLGRWRIRYDIHGREVVLHYCGLRREETFRSS